MKKTKLSLLASGLLLSISATNLFASCNSFTGDGYCVEYDYNGTPTSSPRTNAKDIQFDNGQFSYDTGFANMAKYIKLYNRSNLLKFYDNTYDSDLINYGTLQLNLKENINTHQLDMVNLDFRTNGSITFKAGSKLFINVDSTATGDYVGQTIFDAIYATNGITIEDTLTISDNSSLLDFEYELVGTRTINLKVIQGQTVNDTIASDNQNAGNAAKVLQNIIDNNANNPQMDGVITALNKLGSNKQVAEAVDSTTPQTTTSSFTASNQISNNVSNIVSQRQNINLNGAGLNSGDSMLSEKNIWIKPYGSKGSQDDKNGVNGFDIDTYGIGFGFDGEYAENKQIGFGFFYTNADVEVNNVSQTSDIDVYSLIVYGNTPIFDNKTNLLYQVGYSWQDTTSNRGIEFMGTNAKADYTSKVASLDLKLLRDYRVNEKLLLQPLVSTTYRHFESPSYSESGADALNLDVDKFTSNELILGVGALGFYKLNENSNLFGNVNIGYDLKDDNNIVSSSYQGASGLSFETEGIDNGRFSYDLGIGYENNINDLSNINFSYNFQGEGSDYTNHVISAKYTYKF